MKISERLKALREARDLTQQEVARGCGIDIRTFQRYESDQREPRIPQLITLADYFGVTLDYLVGRSDDPGGGSSAPSPVQMLDQRIAMTPSSLVNQLMEHGWTVGLMSASLCVMQKEDEPYVITVPLLDRVLNQYLEYRILQLAHIV